MRCSRALINSGVKRGGARRAAAAVLAGAMVVFMPLPMGAQVSADASPAPAIELLSEVVVDAPAVRLSDMLPKAVRGAERAMAEGITLGRAPQPGSFRVFRTEQIENAARGKLRVRVPVAVIVHRSGWPITKEQIRAALEDRGKTSEIFFSEDVVSRDENPPLELVSLKPGWGEQTSLAQLRCVERSECGTFMAVLKGSLERQQPASAMRSSARSKSTLVHPGRKALLVIAGEGMRITVPVLPMSRAALGQTVRVLDPAAHRILVGQVRGEDLLGIAEGR